MRLKTAGMIGLAAFALLQIASWAQIEEFVPAFYYVLPLGTSETSVNAVIQAARASAFTIAQYTGSGYDITCQGELTDWTFPTFLEAPRTLLVDGARYRLHVSGEDSTYTVRPGATGQDLVIRVESAVPVAEALEEILQSLHSLGLVGMELSLTIQSFDRSVVKGPPPPSGVPIDSSLYHLMIAEDWYTQAAVYGLLLYGLRAEVVAEVLPGESIPQPFSAYAVGQAENTVKLLMPIEQLVLLAQADEIGYVRPPYRPAVP